MIEKLRRLAEDGEGRAKPVVEKVEKAQGKTDAAAINIMREVETGLLLDTALAGCAAGICRAPGVGHRCARGFDRDLWALSQLVAAAGQVGGLGGVARQFDGFVVGRA